MSEEKLEPFKIPEHFIDKDSDDIPRNIKKALKGKKNKFFNSKTNQAFFKDDKTWYEYKDKKEVPISDGDLIEYLESQLVPKQEISTNSQDKNI